MMKDCEIKMTIIDSVQDFVYYDRKDDEDLPRGAIEQAIDSGEITIDDIVNQFKESLISWNDNRIRS